MLRVGGISVMTNKCYFELRAQAANGNDSLAADLARHLHARQYLGKAAIICNSPHAMLSSLRKQRLKLSRTVQKQRASTLNADKILKYTHAITHMQHLKFTTKPPNTHPDADVFVLEPGATDAMLPNFWSVYVTTGLPAAGRKNIIAQLPGEALVIDYTGAHSWEKLGLKPKAELDRNVEDEWRQAVQFLQSHNIDVDELNSGGQQNVEVIDNALDTLLGTSHKFLSVANGFQRAVELARPMRTPKQLRNSYDSFILLAHRVQALSQNSFTQRFLETYNEDDTFFLHDNEQAYRTLAGDILATAIAAHLAAGRLHLARALQQGLVA